MSIVQKAPTVSSSSVSYGDIDKFEISGTDWDFASHPTNFYHEFLSPKLERRYNTFRMMKKRKYLKNMLLYLSIVHLFLVPMYYLTETIFHVIASSFFFVMLLSFWVLTFKTKLGTVLEHYVDLFGLIWVNFVTVSLYIIPFELKLGTESTSRLILWTFGSSMVPPVVFRGSYRFCFWGVMSSFIMFFYGIIRGFFNEDEPVGIASVMVALFGCILVAYRNEQKVFRSAFLMQTALIKQMLEAEKKLTIIDQLVSNDKTAKNMDADTKLYITSMFRQGRIAAIDQSQYQGGGLAHSRSGVYTGTGGPNGSLHGRKRGASGHLLGAGVAGLTPHGIRGVSTRSMSSRSYVGADSLRPSMALPGRATPSRPSSAASSPLSSDDEFQAAEAWDLEQSFGGGSLEMSDFSGEFSIFSRLASSGLDRFESNAFEIADLTHGHPLFYLALYHLDREEILDALDLDGQALRAFLIDVEGAYNAGNPYHNGVHATDVLGSFMALVRNAPLLFTALSHEEKLAAIVACCVHDLDHPGHNNAFEIAIMSERSLLYNDVSVLENYHIAKAFDILFTPGHMFLPVDFLARPLGTETDRKAETSAVTMLSTPAFQQFRELVVQLVLASDMTLHYDNLGQFQSLLSHGPSPHTHIDHRRILLRTALKIADIAHTMKPLATTLNWVARVNQEFFQQGDKELLLQMPVSPFMDRRSQNIPKSQVGFLQFVVSPLVSAWEEWVRSSSKHLHREPLELKQLLAVNTAHFQSLMDKGITTL